VSSEALFPPSVTKLLYARALRKATTSAHCLSLEVAGLALLGLDGKGPKTERFGLDRTPGSSLPAKSYAPVDWRIVLTTTFYFKRVDAQLPACILLIQNPEPLLTAIAEQEPEEQQLEYPFQR
jgi:hypothetical protein